ncbi:hypothetical protein GVX76_08725 [[Haemophilus] felis]|nr:hypothetical protein [[Haemophilus] felis]
MAIQLKMHTKDGNLSIVNIDINPHSATVVTHPKQEVMFELVDTETQLGPEKIRAKRVGNDLHIFIDEDNQVDLIIQEYYSYEPLSSIVGVREDGLFHPYFAENGNLIESIPTLGEDVLAEQVLTLEGAQNTSFFSWKSLLGFLGSSLGMYLAYVFPRDGKGKPVLELDIFPSKNAKGELTGGLTLKVNPKVDTYEITFTPEGKTDPITLVYKQKDGIFTLVTDISHLGLTEQPPKFFLNKGIVEFAPNLFKDNANVSIKAIDAAGLTNEKTLAAPFDQTAQITLNSVIEKDRNGDGISDALTLSGKVTKGATVSVYDKNGNKIAEFIADNTGAAGDLKDWTLKVALDSNNPARDSLEDLTLVVTEPHHNPSSLPLSNVPKENISVEAKAVNNSVLETPVVSAGKLTQAQKDSAGTNNIDDTDHVLNVTFPTGNNAKNEKNKVDSVTLEIIKSDNSTVKVTISKDQNGNFTKPDNTADANGVIKAIIPTENGFIAVLDDTKVPNGSKVVVISHDKDVDNNTENASRPSEPVSLNTANGTTTITTSTPTEKSKTPKFREKTDTLSPITEVKDESIDADNNPESFTAHVEGATAGATVGLYVKKEGSDPILIATVKADSNGKATIKATDLARKDVDFKVGDKLVLQAFEPNKQPSDFSSEVVIPDVPNGKAGHPYDSITPASPEVYTNETLGDGGVRIVANNIKPFETLISKFEDEAGNKIELLLQPSVDGSRLEVVNFLVTKTVTDKENKTVEITLRKNKGSNEWEAAKILKTNEQGVQENVTNSYEYKTKIDDANLPNIQLKVNGADVASRGNGTNTSVIDLNINGKTLVIAENSLKDNSPIDVSIEDLASNASPVITKITGYDEPTERTAEILSIKAVDTDKIANANPDLISITLAGGEGKAQENTNVIITDNKGNVLYNGKIDLNANLKDAKGQDVLGADGQPIKVFSKDNNGNITVNVQVNHNNPNPSSVSVQLQDEGKAPTNPVSTTVPAVAEGTEGHPNDKDAPVKPELSQTEEGVNVKFNPSTTDKITISVDGKPVVTYNKDPITGVMKADKEGFPDIPANKGDIHIPRGKLPESGKVSVNASDLADNSKPSNEITLEAIKPQLPPVKLTETTSIDTDPVADPFPNRHIIKGEGGTPGATVIATNNKTGEEIGRGTVNQDGTFTIHTKDLPNGEVNGGSDISVSQDQEGMRASDPVVAPKDKNPITHIETTPPAKATETNTNDNNVDVVIAPDADKTKVEYTDASGNKHTATVTRQDDGTLKSDDSNVKVSRDENGHDVITVPAEATKPNTEVNVTSTDLAGNQGTTTTVITHGNTAQVQPTDSNTNNNGTGSNQNGNANVGAGNGSQPSTPTLTPPTLTNTEGTATGVTGSAGGTTPVTPNTGNSGSTTPATPNADNNQGAGTTGGVQGGTQGGATAGNPTDTTNQGGGSAGNNAGGTDTGGAGSQPNVGGVVIQLPTNAQTGDKVKVTYQPPATENEPNPPRKEATVSKKEDGSWESNDPNVVVDKDKNTATINGTNVKDESIVTAETENKDGTERSPTVSITTGIDGDGKTVETTEKPKNMTLVALDTNGDGNPDEFTLTGEVGLDAQGKPNAQTVTVTIGNHSQTVNVGTDGKFTVSFTEGHGTGNSPEDFIKEGAEVKITAKAEGKNPSEETKLTIAKLTPMPNNAGETGGNGADAGTNAGSTGTADNANAGAGSTPSTGTNGGNASGSGTTDGNAAGGATDGSTLPVNPNDGSGTSAGGDTGANSGNAGNNAGGSADNGSGSTSGNAGSTGTGGTSTGGSTPPTTGGGTGTAQGTNNGSNADGDNNTSVTHSTYTPPPAEPTLPTATINNLALKKVVDTDQPANGDFDQFVISGSVSGATSGATVSIYDHKGNLLGSGAVGTNGEFEITATENEGVDLEPKGGAENTLTIKVMENGQATKETTFVLQETNSGNNNSLTKEYTDKQSPEAAKPTANTIDGSVSITVPTNATTGDKITITLVETGAGKTQDGKDQTTTVTLTRNPDGSWSSDKPNIIPDLRDGENTIKIPEGKVKDNTEVKTQVTDLAGNSSAESTATAGTDRTTHAPSNIVMTSVDLDSKANSSIEKVKIEGKVIGEPAGTTISIKDKTGKVIGTATTSAPNAQGESTFSFIVYKKDQKNLDKDNTDQTINHGFVDTLEAGDQFSFSAKSGDKGDSPTETTAVVATLPTPEQGSDPKDLTPTNKEALAKAHPNDTSLDTELQDGSFATFTAGTDGTQSAVVKLPKVSSEVRNAVLVFKKESGIDLIVSFYRDPNDTNNPKKWAMSEAGTTNGLTLTEGQNGDFPTVNVPATALKGTGTADERGKLSLTLLDEAGNTKKLESQVPADQKTHLKLISATAVDVGTGNNISDKQAEKAKIELEAEAGSSVTITITSDGKTLTKTFTVPESGNTITGTTGVSLKPTTNNEQNPKTENNDNGDSETIYTLVVEVESKDATNGSAGFTLKPESKVDIVAKKANSADGVAKQEQLGAVPNGKAGHEGDNDSIGWSENGVTTNPISQGNFNDKGEAEAKIKTPTVTDVEEFSITFHKQNTTGPSTEVSVTYVRDNNNGWKVKDGTEAHGTTYANNEVTIPADVLDGSRANDTTANHPIKVSAADIAGNPAVEHTNSSVKDKAPTPAVDVEPNNGAAGTSNTYKAPTLTAVDLSTSADKTAEKITIDGQNSAIAGATLTLKKADGTPVMDKDGAPITTTADNNGNYSFVLEKEAENGAAATTPTAPAAGASGADTPKKVTTIESGYKISALKPDHSTSPDSQNIAVTEVARGTTADKAQTHPNDNTAPEVQKDSSVDEHMGEVVFMLPITDNAVSSGNGTAAGASTGAGGATTPVANATDKVAREGDRIKFMLEPQAANGNTVGGTGQPTAQPNATTASKLLELELKNPNASEAKDAWEVVQPTATAGATPAAGQGGVTATKDNIEIEKVTEKDGKQYWKFTLRADKPVETTNPQADRPTETEGANPTGTTGEPTTAATHKTTAKDDAYIKTLAERKRITGLKTGDKVKVTVEDYAGNVSSEVEGVVLDPTKIDKLLFFKGTAATANEKDPFKAHRLVGVEEAKSTTDTTTTMTQNGASGYNSGDVVFKVGVDHTAIRIEYTTPKWVNTLPAETEVTTASAGSPTPSTGTATTSGFESKVIWAVKKETGWELQGDSNGKPDGNQLADAAQIGKAFEHKATDANAAAAPATAPATAPAASGAKDTEFDKTGWYIKLNADAVKDGSAVRAIAYDVDGNTKEATLFGVPEVKDEPAATTPAASTPAAAAPAPAPAPATTTSSPSPADKPSLRGEDMVADFDDATDTAVEKIDPVQSNNSDITISPKADDATAVIVEFETVSDSKLTDVMRNRLGLAGSSTGTASQPTTGATPAGDSKNYLVAMKTTTDTLVAKNGTEGATTQQDAQSNQDVQWKLFMYRPNPVSTGNGNTATAPSTSGKPDFSKVNGKDANLVEVPSEVATIDAATGKITLKKDVVKNGSTVNTQAIDAYGNVAEGKKDSISNTSPTFSPNVPEPKVQSLGLNKISVVPGALPYITTKQSTSPQPGNTGEIDDTPTDTLDGSNFKTEIDLSGGANFDNTPELIIEYQPATGTLGQTGYTEPKYVLKKGNNVTVNNGVANSSGSTNNNELKVGDTISVNGDTSSNNKTVKIESFDPNNGNLVLSGTEGHKVIAVAKKTVNSQTASSGSSSSNEVKSKEVSATFESRDLTPNAADQATATANNDGSVTINPGADNTKVRIEYYEQQTNGANTGTNQAKVITLKKKQDGSGWEKDTSASGNTGDDNHFDLNNGTIKLKADKVADGSTVKVVGITTINATTGTSTSQDIEAEPFSVNAGYDNGSVTPPTNNNNNNTITENGADINFGKGNGTVEFEDPDGNKVTITVKPKPDGSKELVDQNGFPVDDSVATIDDSGKVTVKPDAIKPGTGVSGTVVTPSANGGTPTVTTVTVEPPKAEEGGNQSSNQDFTLTSVSDSEFKVHLNKPNEVRSYMIKFKVYDTQETGPDYNNGIREIYVKVDGKNNDWSTNTGSRYEGANWGANITSSSNINFGSSEIPITLARDGKGTLTVKSGTRYKLIADSRVEPKFLDVKNENLKVEMEKHNTSTAWDALKTEIQRSADQVGYLMNKQADSDGPNSTKEKTSPADLYNDRSEGDIVIVPRTPTAGNDSDHKKLNVIYVKEDGTTAKATLTKENGTWKHTNIANSDASDFELTNANELKLYWWAVKDQHINGVQVQAFDKSTDKRASIWTKSTPKDNPKNPTKYPENQDVKENALDKVNDGGWGNKAKGDQNTIILNNDFEVRYWKHWDPKVNYYWDGGAPGLFLEQITKKGLGNMFWSVLEKAGSDRQKTDYHNTVELTNALELLVDGDMGDWSRGYPNRPHEVKMFHHSWFAADSQRMRDSKKRIDAQNGNSQPQSANGQSDETNDALVFRNNLGSDQYDINDGRMFVDMGDGNNVIGVGVGNFRWHIYQKQEKKGHLKDRYKYFGDWETAEATQFGKHLASFESYHLANLFGGKFGGASGGRLYNSDLKFGKGDDALFIDGSFRDWHAGQYAVANATVEMGAGDDLLLMSRQNLDYFHDAVTGMIGNNSVINMGDGRDHIESVGFGGNAKIMLGNGNDSVSIARMIDSNTELSAGAGADVVHVHGEVRDGAKINLGDGDDVFIFGQNTAKDHFGVVLFGGGESYGRFEGFLDGGDGYDIVKLYKHDETTIRSGNVTNLSTANIRGIEEIWLDNGASVDIRYDDLLADNVNGHIKIRAMGAGSGQAGTANKSQRMVVDLGANNSNNDFSKDLSTKNGANGGSSTDYPTSEDSSVSPAKGYTNVQDKKWKFDHTVKADGVIYNVFYFGGDSYNSVWIEQGIIVI